jgi:putative ABC transport system permease protein
LAQILRELSAIYPRALQDYGVPERFLVNSLQDDVTGAVKPALLAVLGAVALLLLIACVNVTNLLLARGAQRRGEFVVRAALGAGRARLIRQLLTESLLLAGLGGAVGMALAMFGVDLLKALGPPGLPRVEVIGVKGAVFVFALGVTTLIGLLVGLIPALHVSRSDLRRDLQQSSRRTSGGQQLTRRALVVAEVALALVLLVSAGLLLRSLQQPFAISPGFDSSNLLTLQVRTAGQHFADDAATQRFFARALDAVRRVPGVTAAAFTSQLPLSGELDEYGAQFESGPDGQPERGYSSFRYTVSPSYFETMGIPLKRGRFLDAHDMAGAQPVTVISESLAQARFGAADPLGKRVHIGRKDLPWFTIVGVVGDVKQASLMASRTAAAYVTPAQWYFADNAMSLVVRARGDVAALVPSLRQAIWSVDQDQPIVRVATMDSLLAATAAERHDGTLDLSAEFQQLGVSAPLRRLRPHALKDLALCGDCIGDFCCAHDWVISIGSGSQGAKSSQQVVFVLSRRVT